MFFDELTIAQFISCIHCEFAYHFTHNILQTFNPLMTKILFLIKLRYNVATKVQTTIFMVGKKLSDVILTLNRQIQDGH